MHDGHALLRRGLLLEYITIGWNVVGALAVVAAIDAHSAALAAFGLDSLVEIGASTVVIWQLRGTGAQREQHALRLISIAFFALAIYVSGQSAYTLLLCVHPASSPWGIFWLGLTLAVMLALAAGKHVTGAALDNSVLKAEARVTLVDAYLAGSVLLGLAFNTLFGWWWADPLAGFIVVYYGLREGSQAWRESRRPA